MPSLGSSIFKTNDTSVDENAKFEQLIYINPLENNKFDARNTVLTFGNDGVSSSLLNASGAEIKIYKVPHASREFMPYGFYWIEEMASDPGVEDVTANFENKITRIKRTTSSSRDVIQIDFGTVAKNESYVVYIKGDIYNGADYKVNEENAQYFANTELKFSKIEYRDSIGIKKYLETIVKNNSLKKGLLFVGGNPTLEIKNEKLPTTTSVQVTKVWKGRVKEEVVRVQLYKNGKKVEGKSEDLNEGNGWTVTFEDLPVYKDDDKQGEIELSSVRPKVEGMAFRSAPAEEELEENVYTVKEVGAENGVLVVGDNKYNVAVTGSQTEGYTITNTYVPSTPWTPPEPEHPQTVDNKKDYPSIPKTGESSDVSSTVMFMFAGLLLLIVAGKRRAADE